jgi:tellurite methyltransferase
VIAESSIGFFDRQFRRQAAEGDLRLNPFEQLALPHLRGRVLDYGCGLGNLAVAAARQGCCVVALDASPAGIAHLRERARAEGLPIEAVEADLRTHVLHGDFDAVACWEILAWRREVFPAPEGTVKAFATLVARKPGCAEGGARA